MINKCFNFFIINYPSRTNLQLKLCCLGLSIHFQHVKPTIPKGRNLKVYPMLIVHGWPGSIIEFQKIIPLLTTPRPDVDYVFEVIAPSLPGYGFSDAAVRPGLGISEVWNSDYLNFVRRQRKYCFTWYKLHLKLTQNNEHMFTRYRSIFYQYQRWNCDNKKSLTYLTFFNFRF